MARCRRGRVSAHPASDTFCSPQVKLTVPFTELRGEYEAFLPNLAESLLVPVHDSLLLPLAPADEEALQ